MVLLRQSERTSFLQTQALWEETGQGHSRLCAAAKAAKEQAAQGRHICLSLSFSIAQEDSVIEETIVLIAAASPAMLPLFP